MQDRPGAPQIVILAGEDDRAVAIGVAALAQERHLPSFVAEAATAVGVHALSLVQGLHDFFSSFSPAAGIHPRGRVEADAVYPPGDFFNPDRVRRCRDNAGVAKIYALANQKGGVGKTTTAINLAACLAEAGERALVVDLDPQANATSGLGMRANGSSSYDLLDGAPLAELAKHTQFANLDLVPSKPELAGAVVELAQRADGERYLKEALASGSSQYSFVFLDCPPSLGPLTVNALAAADRVLVPVQAEYYALEGLSQLMQSIDLIRRRLNPQLGIGGVLLTMVDSRTRLAQDVEAEVRKHFGALVFDQTVPRSVRLAEAPSHGLPAIAYDRQSRGADAYWKVAMELVERA